MKRKDIRIRDPFILTDKKNGCYYMYGTTELKPSSMEAGNCFSVYKSSDLENFEGPKVIFDGKKQGFYADRDFWAAEVHEYRGKYYLFGSVKAENTYRATHIFVADKPDGEFVPLADTARTPNNWECIDGTLWVENETPYMVFCHGGIQAKQGDICAVRLSQDLQKTEGKPFVLFSAKDNPFVSALPEEWNLGKGVYCVDGPFLYKENGKLKMIWSSFIGRKYHVFEAVSEGGIKGKWLHFKGDFDFEGGHAMLFEDLDGTRRIAMHAPNRSGEERLVTFKY